MAAAPVAWAGITKRGGFRHPYGSPDRSKTLGTAQERKGVDPHTSAVVTPGDASRRAAPACCAAVLGWLDVEEECRVRCGTIADKLGTRRQRRL